MARDQWTLARNKSVHNQENLETDSIGEDRVENSKSALGIVVVVFSFVFVLIGLMESCSTQVSMIEKIQAIIHPSSTANSLANEGRYCIQEVSFHQKSHWTLNSLTLRFVPTAILTLVLSMKVPLNTLFL